MIIRMQYIKQSSSVRFDNVKIKLILYIFCHEQGSLRKQVLCTMFIPIYQSNFNIEAVVQSIHKKVGYIADTRRLHLSLSRGKSMHNIIVYHAT